MLDSTYVQSIVMARTTTLLPFCATYHVAGRCAKWADLRAMFWAQHDGGMPDSLEAQVRIFFSTRPSESTDGVALAWAGSLDRDTKQFWADEM